MCLVFVDLYVNGKINAIIVVLPSGAWHGHAPAIFTITWGHKVKTIHNCIMKFPKKKKERKKEKNCQVPNPSNEPEQNVQGSELKTITKCWRMKKNLRAEWTEWAPMHAL